ncbi:protein phosphatase 2C, putative [Leishmania tarentolae]|uniref:protein-serine/threonine phosphatase n=1 Tax=Leishmania tarentolae TaxID=5689 RepID=A0A640KD26_LEITA|nr:protein phosphatase 2C, putative [Leishmania tarentolae]
MPVKQKNLGGSKHGMGCKGDVGKTKRQAEEDEFEKFLSDLSRKTQHIGMERTERRAKEERIREGQRKKHAELAKQRSTNELENALINRQKSMQLQQLLAELLTAQRPFGSKPTTDFHSETHTDNPYFDIAVGDMQGWRAQMEDAHLVNVKFLSDGANSKEGYFGVFDGHSGVQCANLCSQIFSSTVERYATPAGNHHHHINFEKVFLDVDSQLKDALGEGGSGCTAVTVYVSVEEITCAWVGDSRAVLCRSGGSFALSHDHKPDVAAEKERIEAAGGFVQDNRVNGQLAMSRAMGDFVYKRDANRGVAQQLVVPVPGVTTTKRCAEDSYVAIACDGIFDVLTNEELIDFINEKKARGMSNIDICRDVCNRCLAPSSPEGGPAVAEGTDNMTIMIVDLK